MSHPRRPLLTPPTRWTPPKHVPLASRSKRAGPPPILILILALVAAGGGWWLFSGPTENRRAGPGNVVEIVEFTGVEPPQEKASILPAVAEALQPLAPGREPTVARLESNGSADMLRTAEPGDLESVPEETPEAEISDRLETEPALILTGTDATATPEIARDRELLEATAEEGSWDEYRAFIERSLLPVVAPLPEVRTGSRFDSLWNEPAFYQAFLRQQVLARFPASVVNTTEKSGEFLRWFLGSNEPMEELLLTLHPDDDPAKVLGFLANAHYVSSEFARKYINLTIACAVVFDRPLRIQADDGPGRYLGERVVNGMDRFHWYVDRSENKKLAVPVDRSSARDLVWVVSAPVPEIELDWALAEMRMRRQNWGSAYGMVEYLMERAVNGLNPYQEYSFSEILKEGGICGDQAYFCVNTARAQGIPAISLSGETDLGPHAWAAVKTEPDEWDSTIGRIGGVADGGGYHPQTGGRISEQEVWLWNDRGQKSQTTRLGTFRLLWLADFIEPHGEKPLAAESIRVANSIGRAFPESWLRLHGLLVAKTREGGEGSEKELVPEWVDFVSGMRSQFRDNPRMGSLASEAELEFILPHLPEDEARRILASARRKIDRMTGEQKDLVADAIKAEADLIASGGSADALEKIGQLYSRGMRSYGENVTAFKRMAEDYFGLVRDDPAAATKAARDIESAFLRVVETGSKNWFRANTEVSIYKMICTYHREAGDETRAEKLERRYTRLLESAERGALR